MKNKFNITKYKDPIIDVMNDPKADKAPKNYAGVISISEKNVYNFHYTTSESIQIQFMLRHMYVKNIIADNLQRTWTIYGYSWWFDSIEEAQEIPLYTLWIGSRNGGLICANLGD